jgi:tRNA U34 5-carboxymethylaminomethyl modifying enzyme MnmG/GidA
MVFYFPSDIQFKALRSVVVENVKFFEPGYAIEYDYFPPTQLKHTLETKLKVCILLDKLMVRQI